jgi:hypothetical protein
MVPVTDDPAAPGAPVETTAGAPPPVDPTWLQLVAQMRQHFDRADQAMRAGNLALYAEEMKQAEAVLRKLEKFKR